MSWSAFFRRLLNPEFETHPKRETYVIATQLDFDQVVATLDAGEAASLTTAWHSDGLLDQVGAAIVIRRHLADAMGPVELGRYVRHLMLRYRAAAGDAAYERYLATAPKDPTTPEFAQAEAHTLLERLRLAYSVVHLRDRHLMGIRMRFLFVLFVELVLVIAMLLGVFSAQATWLVNFEFVALVGLVGSTVSILRRSENIAAAATFADDPVVQISALRYGDWGLYAAALSGAVFAVVLAMIFMGNMVSVQGLTPSFCSPPGGAHCPGPLDQFTILQRNYALIGYADGAKLLVLCFLAGFAEQLVPDVLDRFAQTIAKK